MKTFHFNDKNTIQTKEVGIKERGYKFILKHFSPVFSDYIIGSYFKSL